MIATIFEKLIYIITIIILYLQHRVASNQLVRVGADSIFWLLFVASYLKTSAMNHAN